MRNVKNKSIFCVCRLKQIRCKKIKAEKKNSKGDKYNFHDVLDAEAFEASANPDYNSVTSSNVSDE